MLLAIDTSAGTGAAVVDRHAGILAERAVADTRRHAEVIGAVIADCLREACVQPADLEGVVCGMGPGPFTGLRVGIAAARVYALGIAKPLYPVISHDAVAAAWYADGSGPLLVVTDARRREFYWSAYSGVDEAALPIRLDGPGLAKPEDVPAASGARVEAAEVSAAQLGLLAEAMLAAGRPFPADQALYLRSPDVTMPGARKRVSG